MENCHKFFANKDCKYYPCHEAIEELNCLFCYCPMYRMDSCLGQPVFKETKNGVIKDCSGCTFPHCADNYEAIMQALSGKKVCEFTDK